MTKKKSNGTPVVEKEKEDAIVVEGVVLEAIKGSFRVEMCSPGVTPDPKNPQHVMNAHLAGKMRKNNIRIVPGDRVQVEVSPYDIHRGRIVYRMKT